MHQQHHFDHHQSSLQQLLRDAILVLGFGASSVAQRFRNVSWKRKVTAYVRSLAYTLSMKTGQGHTHLGKMSNRDTESCLRAPVVLHMLHRRLCASSRRSRSSISPKDGRLSGLSSRQSLIRALIASGMWFGATGRFWTVLSVINCITSLESSPS